MKRRRLNDYTPTVAQDNNFIQHYIYSQKLSITDIKVFKAILSKVKHNLNLFDEFYVIDYSTLDIAGVPQRNRYKEVEKSLINLMNTFVTIREEDRARFDDPILKKAKGDRKLGLIRNDWTHEKKSSKIVISISDILRPFFLELADKEYTIYELENISDFKNVYELKFYELFSKWRNRGYFNVTIKNLRKYLEIEDDKYPRFANFKQHILLPSIKKIEQTTNLSIRFRELKSNGEILEVCKGPGNKAWSLEFVIADKQNFNKEKYITKKFKSSDGVVYIILEINEDTEGKLTLKLYDTNNSTTTKLIRPITVEEFISSIVED